MKTASSLLIVILVVCTFTITLGNIFSEVSLMDAGSQQLLEGNIAYEGYDKTGAVSPSVSPAKSIVRVCDGKNQSTSVVLDSQLNLTWMTVGSSTIINPPLEVRNKIDANLLNLTELVTKGYLQNNETNVIIALDKTPFEEISDSPAQENLLNNTCRPYTSKQAYSYMHFLAAHLAYSGIFDLAKTSQVNHIWLDRKFQACLDQSVRIIKDPTVWASIESSFHRNINGSGVRVAILDTGIDSTHSDFSFPNGTSKIVGAISFTGEPTTDGYGHGTHCASIAAGTGAASAGQYVGVAPSAALLNVKVLDNTGEGLESWVISGIQWAVDNNANILSMSFGASLSSDGTDPLSTTVNWATEQGVVCVVAAGNSGSEMYTITSPGVAELAITVGASSKTDVTASFSSRGPTSDQRIKPDVVAPGVGIVAARASGTSMGTPISQYYTQASGTSMATPHVAGAAALLLDAHPSWSPIRVKMALANYAKYIGASVLDEGTGRIDVCKAANASAVGDSSISFGRVNTNTIYKQVFTIQNLADRTLSIALNAKAWHISYGTLYNVASMNTSSLVLSSGATGKVELSLDTSGSLPDGYFEGRINATFGDAGFRIPFFFCILSQLNVEATDESGSKLMAAFALIDAQTGATRAYSSECAGAQFVMLQGTYVVQAMNIYALSPSSSLDTKISFLIHKKFSIGIGETMNLQLSLTSAHKLDVRTTDVQGSPLYLVHKQLLTPYYTMGYLSDIGMLTNQYIYLTNLDEYIKPPCFFGFAGFPQDYSYWTETGALVPEVDAYFIGWDLSTFGLSEIPGALNYENSELATFDIEIMLPKSSAISTIWFNQISGMWQSGLWYGHETHPGICWKAHILPYQFKTDPSANWSELEWSCIYTLSARPGESAEYYVIDRHFEPIEKGENFLYHVGKTPLLPQTVYNNVSHYGSGLFIPYYPVLVESNLFIAKTDPQATKRVEILREGILIYNQTKSWAQEPIDISHFLQSHGHGLYSFIVKTGTSLDYSSQNVAKYTINYTDSSTDLIPPSITKVECAPCFTDNEYQVEIQLADNDRLGNVSLLYSTDNDSWFSLPLTHLEDGRYSATLIIPSAAQKMSLTIEATDGNGNSMEFSTKPATARGYETRINATLDTDRISGKLTVVGGAIVQPVYLKVESSQKLAYVLTDAEGNFEFSVPQYMVFPLKIEMANMGTYEGSIFYLNKPQVHDVSVTQLVPSKAVASAFANVSIQVTIANQGDYAETFNVTVYGNATPIASQIATLSGKDSTTISIAWNITGFVKGNYTISAYAQPVPGEIEIADNNFTDGWIVVTIPGDINGDYAVDVYDAILLSTTFGAEKSSPYWNPNADINGDGIIGIFDAIIMSTYFGTRYP